MHVIKNKLYFFLYLFISLIIILLIIILFSTLSYQNNRLIKEEILTKARAFFSNIVLTRRWNAYYGGVYVEKKEGIKSNPYLENPDINTQDNKIYTLRNPALMTKEISRYAEKDGLFTYHITSLKLVNPENTPDHFELDALIQFDQGKPEAYLTTTIDQKKLFRYMAPLYFEESCNACHAKQNYAVGEVRGGISVTFSIDKISQKTMNYNILLTFIALSLIIVILVIIKLVFSKFIKSIEEEKKIIICQNERLEELNKIKNEFLGIAAHDLRNPISAIKGFSDIIISQKDLTLPERTMRILKVIHRSSDYMLNLLSDFLDFTKIEAGKLILQKEKTSYISLIRENIELNQIIAAARNIRITLEAPDDELLITIDRNKIEQVLNNLLNNAIKFSKHNALIEVTIKKNTNYITTIVTDHGRGIPEADVQKIFNVFETGMTKDDIKLQRSYGLGLAIAKKIIEEHGGIINVKSEFNKGATFYYTLPLDN